MNEAPFGHEDASLISGPRHQYDVLSAARGDGWATMLDWADYMAEADLKNISQATAGALGMRKQSFAVLLAQKNAMKLGKPIPEGQ